MASNSFAFFQLLGRRIAYYSARVKSQGHLASIGPGFFVARQTVERITRTHSVLQKVLPFFGSHVVNSVLRGAGSCKGVVLAEVLAAVVARSQQWSSPACEHLYLLHPNGLAKKKMFPGCPQKPPCDRTCHSPLPPPPPPSKKKTEQYKLRIERKHPLKRKCKINKEDKK